MDERNNPRDARETSGRASGPANSERIVIPAGEPARTTERMESAPAVADRTASTVNRSAGSRTAPDMDRKVSQAADAAMDKTKQTLSEAGDKASNLASTATNKVKSAADSAEDKLTDTGHKVASGAESMKDQATDAVDDISVPGPVLSSVLGALAGALGGWWLGRSEPDENSGFTTDDERHYREHFDSHKAPGVTYSVARPGYLLGHMAARNPGYQGHSFEQIEADLRQGFRSEYGLRYETIRPYAKHAFERREGGLFPAVLGGLAGALGGWWAGSSSDTATQMPEEEENACRVHFSSHAPRAEGITYETVRPGYALGYLAAQNPSYRGRRFEEIEADLRRGFSGEHEDRYTTLRDFARHGYERGAASASTGTR